MKLLDAARRNAKLNTMKRWHSWFAWRPVTLENGDVVWLEYIERRYDFIVDYDGTDVLVRYRWPAQEAGK